MQILPPFTKLTPSVCTLRNHRAGHRDVVERSPQRARGEGEYRKLDELEKKFDSQFSAVFDAIRQLMVPAASARRRIGFRA